MSVPLEEVTAFLSLRTGLDLLQGLQPDSDLGNEPSKRVELRIPEGEEPVDDVLSALADGYMGGCPASVSAR